MNMKKREGILQDSDELFNRYMAMISRKDTESTCRLKSDTGEGIMRCHHVAKGVELIYSEIESYIPMFQEQKRSVRCLELMYMVEGHADFEMENRHFASADKGDVMLFNSRVGTRSCRVGKGGMCCISIVVFLDDLADTLNRFFKTKDFDKETLFAEAERSESCICFPANDLLSNIFTGLMQVPERYGEYHRKLMTLQAIVALLDARDGRMTGHRYFSGDTARKVHEARKILGENLSASYSVEMLAARVKLNRTTLQQVFRQMYGMTVYEYRTQVRMQEARNLLLRDELTVTDVAGLCGYTNASKFAAVFRRVTGSSPAEWRRKEQSIIQNPES